MAKQIEFEYNGKHYCLEYTRRSVAEMERNGFVASDVSDKPVTAIPALFAGAFRAHHPMEKRAVIDEIYNHLPNKTGFISALAEMYAEPVSSLLDEPEGNEGNVVNWTPSWEIKAEE